jgi:membrane fusion protein (multidrug efflux system)
MPPAATANWPPRRPAVRPIAARSHSPGLDLVVTAQQTSLTAPAQRPIMPRANSSPVRMIPMPKVLLILTVLLAASSGTAVAAPSMTPPQVILEAARAAQLADPIEALGTLRANEAVAITATVSDVIAAVHFEDGQQVRAGQLLVQMSNAEEAALLKEAQSLEDEAELQFNRVRSLVDQGSASQALLDERRRDWQSAHARATAVRSRLEDRVITAPFSGTLGLRQVSPGALVGPGTVITTLVDDSEMKLDFTIPALYLGAIARGAEVVATTSAFPSESFSGVLTSVDSVINPVTRSIALRARIPNPDHRLVQGMLMTLDLARTPRTAITIAEGAIIPRGDRAFVYVVNPDQSPTRADEREVRIGARLPGRVEVTAGLEAGELVITHGTIRVRPGSVVQIRAIDDGTKPLAELIASDAAVQP